MNGWLGAALAKEVVAVGVKEMAEVPNMPGGAAPELSAAPEEEKLVEKEGVVRENTLGLVSPSPQPPPSFDSAGPNSEGGCCCCC